MDAALTVLKQARTEKRRIRVYGDYDADGVTATALMYRGLLWAGFERVDYYIPNRFDEGYGLHREAVQQAVDDGVELMITVDCGSSSPEAADLARQLGLVLIITDHHGLPPRIPDVPALVNPEKMAVPNRFSGAGVCLQVVRALLNDNVPPWAYAVAAVGTVADVVPLRGDNRTLVQKGLPALDDGRCPGISALLEGRIKPGQHITAEDLAFFVGPHLNAAGRMGDAKPAVSLLLAESADDGKVWAEELRGYNLRRREIERELVAESMRQIPVNGAGNVPGFVVVAGDGWHHGVVGIVASRLKDQLKRPAAVIGWEGDAGKGSARSVPGLNLLQHMALSREIFLKLGGHRGACGFSLARQDPGELSERLSRELPKELLAQQFIGAEVDAQLDISQLNAQAAEELASFEPYGHGFERPRFAVRASVQSVRRMGALQNHLAVTLEGSPFRAVAFNQGDVSWGLETQPDSEFIGELVLNQFQGRVTPQWHIDQFIGVAPGKIGWAEQTIFSNPPGDIGGRVVYIVNSTREQKAWARKLDAEAFYHYETLGSWARKEQYLQSVPQGAVVVNQWTAWPHLIKWADHVVWLTIPLCQAALSSAAALLQEPGGKMWLGPNARTDRVKQKARRLAPTRASLGRLWKAWESGRTPMLVGARVLRELDLHRGEKPSVRRQLASSPSFRRAQRLLACVERDELDLRQRIEHKD